MSESQPTESVPVATLSETENYIVWISEEPDGETTYHIELGSVTMHFFPEEWAELQQLMKAASK